MKVLAAMSGGVDSAVAAARAADAGHDVTGVHLALSESPQSHRTGARGCCTLEDSRDARRAADVIGIPFYVWGMAERFGADVVDDFVAEYAAGRTPNPCLRCNEKIKFAAVLDRALALGFDAVVTGHHARLSGGVLRRSVDAAKDQSYVLAVLTRAQLAHSIFPLGDSTKVQVRAEAAERGLTVADKPDSHDICFIPDGDTAGFLRERLGGPHPDRVRHGADVEHVPGLAVGGGPPEPQAPPLPDRVGEGSVVAAEHLAGGGVDDLARPLAEALAQETGRVAVGNETDVVAVRLVRHGQPPLGRLGPHLVLGRVTQREDRVGELRAGQDGEHVRLVLGG
ncbi:MAG: tRNA-uridine 2-sulfurtransferase, partial [Cryptosporangiaceae bacterium]|nr:tRNA-uridine 2-sulfurtransferase [Cryptosporangiaceae bacterium]